MSSALNGGGTLFFSFWGARRLADIGKLDSAEFMRNVLLGKFRFGSRIGNYAGCWRSRRDSHRWLAPYGPGRSLSAHPVLISDDC